MLSPRCPLPLAADLGEVADPLAAVDEATRRDLLVAATGDRPWTLSFPHPLIRSAVDDTLGPTRRATLHGAAASLVTEESAVLRHGVAATPIRDEDLAADLAGFAEREAGRRAWPSAVAHLVAAARLSPRRGDEERRLLGAVGWLLQNGDAARAEGFAEDVGNCPPGPLRDGVLGSLAMARGEPAVAETWLRSA